MHLFVLLPRSMVTHYLRVIFQKIMLQKIIGVAVFNSLENIVLGVKVVAGLDEVT
jgi:hypothetical protein